MLLRALSTLTLAAASAVTLSAGADPFVGTWKLNLAKSKFSGEQMKIEDLGQNRYRLTAGVDSDTLTADGTDQPVHYGRTESIAKQGPNVWKVSYKKEGKVLSAGTWTLSADGKTILYKGTEFKPDGTTGDYEGTVKRVGSGSGWAGTWESTEVKISSPDQMVISVYQGDGLTFSSPAYKSVSNVKFDGKDYPDSGPDVIEGSTNSGKRTGPNALELTSKIKDKVMDRSTSEVSKDGKTLTVTYHESGQPKPLTVYDKQ